MILFYLEGYSELNFALPALRRKGLGYTYDMGEILESSDLHYLKNCKSDSNIFNSIKQDAWWVKEKVKAKIVIVADLDNEKCYKKFREKLEDFLSEVGLSNSFSVVNSKPEIEQIYLEDHELLKDVIKSFCNSNMQKPVKKFSDLRGSELLVRGCADRHVIKTILQKNRVAFNKRKFSARFFATLYNRNDKTVSISARLEAILSSQEVAGV